MDACRTKLKGVQPCVWAMLPSNGIVLSPFTSALTPPSLKCFNEPLPPPKRQKEGLHDNQSVTLSGSWPLNHILRCLTQLAESHTVSRPLRWGHSPSKTLVPVSLWSLLAVEQIPLSTLSDVMQQRSEKLRSLTQGTNILLKTNLQVMTSRGLQEAPDYSRVFLCALLRGLQPSLNP